VLVDLDVVNGHKPAAYFSRGEGGSFYSALAAEEERENAGASSRPLDESPSHTLPHSLANKPTRLTEEDEELERELREREEERSRRSNARGGS
jgi:hypothetical protein